MTELNEIFGKKILIFLFLFGLLTILIVSLPHFYVPEQIVQPLWIRYREGSVNDMTPEGSLLVNGGGPLNLFNSDGEIIWKTENIKSEFARISDDGEFIVSTLRDKERGTFYGYIVSFDKEGRKLWSYETGWIRAISMTSSGGLIALTAFDENSKGYYTFRYHIYLFDREGNKLWDKVMDQHFESISISENGYIITGSREGMIYLFDKEGKTLFSKDTKSYVQAVAITKDGNYIFFGSNETSEIFPHQTYPPTHFNAYNRNGERIWSQKNVGQVFSISISSDGEYIAVGGSEYFLFNIDGELLWSHSGSAYTPDVAIDERGRYVVADVGEPFFPPFFPFDYLYVFNREGEVLWKYRSKGTIMSLAISDDGRYVTFENRGLDMFFFDNFKAIEEYKKELEVERKIGISYELIVTIIAGILISWKIIKRGTK